MLPLPTSHIIYHTSLSFSPSLSLSTILFTTSQPFFHAFLSLRSPRPFFAPSPQHNPAQNSIPSHLDPSLLHGFRHPHQPTLSPPPPSQTLKSQSQAPPHHGVAPSPCGHHGTSTAAGVSAVACSLRGPAVKMLPARVWLAMASSS